MRTWTDRRYGLLTRGTDEVPLAVAPGQNMGGFPIGILFIDGVRYPFMPGNVCNGWTYDFPVRLRAVPGLHTRELFAADDSLAQRIIAEALELQREGVRAISTGCGFFGNFQKEVAEALDIPVALSALCQVPWVQGLIKPHQKIGVLTASGPDITPKLLGGVGITDPSRLVIRDLGSQPNFSNIITDTHHFDNGAVRAEMVEAARSLFDEPDTDYGAIVLECSDMPPYASDVQAATGLPVFDFITMIRWLESAVAQRPYAGFL